MSTLNTQTLQDQYYLSEWIFERFVNDLNNHNGSLTRTKKKATRNGLNAVIKEEDKVMKYSFFWKEAKDFRAEYREKLDAAIGRKKRLEYFALIRDYWCDKSKRKHGKILALEFQIEQYLKFKSSKSTTICPIPTHTETISLDSKDISSILSITRSVFDRFLQEWLRQFCDIGSNDIYLYRGIELPSSMRKGQIYKEYRFINSYSMSISIAEQFLDTHGVHPKKIMISINNNTLDNRILFFAPLIPRANAKQVELGVIPPIKPIKIQSIMKVDHFEDYKLG